MNARTQTQWNSLTIGATAQGADAGAAGWVQRILAWRDSAAWALVAVLVVLVGWIDYATGQQLSVSLLYLLPVALAAWRFGRGAGYAMALTSAGVWLGADWMVRRSYGHWFLPAWNTATLSASFAVVAALLASLRDANARLEQKVIERTGALREEVAHRTRAEDEARKALGEARFERGNRGPREGERGPHVSGQAGGSGRTEEDA